MSKKLTIIGGGSVRAPFFANNLAKRAKSMGITTLCLYDNDPEKLRMIGGLAKYVAGKVDPGLLVELETDMDKAITGTSYFVTTIRVGGDHSRVVDEEIAVKNGVLGQETTGIGGLFMAARSIPVLEVYLKRIQELAPEAWVFNFTNPSGLVTQALRSLGYDRVIGICDTPSSTKIRIGEAMGYDNQEFYMEFFGLNHLSWARKAMYQGKDVLEDILHAPDITEKVGELGMFDQKLIQLIGHIPNEYLYYYYYRDQAADHIKQSGTSRGRNIEGNNRSMLGELSRMDLEKEPEQALLVYLKHMFSREASYMQIETTKKVLHVPDELVMPEGEGYAGIAMDYVAAMNSGETRYVVLSVPNEGSIHGLADDDVVEVTCAVDQDGAKPVPIGWVDDDVFALMKSVKAFERLAATAIIEGSFDTAVKALMAHPLIGSFEVAKSIIDDFKELHGEYVRGWK